MVLRFLTILFFAVCAVAASYVSAVLMMSVWAHFIGLVPYDTFAFLTCPTTGTCIEYGRSLYTPTLIFGIGILADTCIVCSIIWFFGPKIKMPAKLKKILTPVVQMPLNGIRKTVTAVKTKISRKKPETPDVAH